jgi:hypothetical protein
MLQIYILGVEARFRGKLLLEKIKSTGHAYEIVWGEDAQNSPNRLSYILRFLSKVVNNREISMGEYYCATGHQRILETFVDSGNEWALILEEDAMVLEDISSIEGLTWDTSDPTIVHLAGIDSILQSSKEETFWLKEARAEMHNNQEIIFFRIGGNVFGAFGFLINREAAKIAVSGNRRLRFPQLADWPSTWRHKVKFYITDKSFVFVETSGSELVEHRSQLLESSMKSRKSFLIIKLRGWIKLLQNILLLEPLFKSLVGLSFYSVIHDNLYRYLYFRISIRLRSTHQNDRVNG